MGKFPCWFEVFFFWFNHFFLKIFHPKTSFFKKSSRFFAFCSKKLTLFFDRSVVHMLGRSEIFRSKELPFFVSQTWRTYPCCGGTFCSMEVPFIFLRFEVRIDPQEGLFDQLNFLWFLRFFGTNSRQFFLLKQIFLFLRNFGLRDVSGGGEQCLAHTQKKTKPHLLHFVDSL